MNQFLQICRVKARTIFFFGVLFAGLAFVLVAFIPAKQSTNFSERVKVALRATGNNLLWVNNDGTTLVPPIIEIDQHRFEMTFQNELSIVPDSLVSFMGKNLKPSQSEENYIVEVLNCDNNEVSYSYQVKSNKENNIIPCLGRILPLHCYKVQILFIDPVLSEPTYKNYSLFSLVIIGFIAVGVFVRKEEKNKKDSVDHAQSFTTLGSTRFYHHQNKLVLAEKEIKLSSKECELLKIFGKNKNNIVKRELLMKEVWEDNGVVVGRSLDTFISKLRKKLEGDPSVRLTNIHGVGYKLEISDTNS